MRRSSGTEAGRPRAAAAIAAAALLVPAAPSFALEDEELELWVSQAYSHDDNLFRLAPGADPVTELGTPHRSDSYLTTAAGLRIDTPWRRQRFVLELSFDRERYERFGLLDLDGHEGRLLWHWQLQSRARGRAGYGESRVLASLANVQGGEQSSTPNFLESRQWMLDGAFDLTPRWRLEAAVRRQQQENSAQEFSPSDATLDELQAGPVYVTRAGNRIGLSLRQLRGELPNPLPVAGVPVDNDYRQQEAEAFVEWRPGAQIAWFARAGAARREYRELPQRDFESWLWRAGCEWKPVEKLYIVVQAAREISPYEQVNVGLVLAEVQGVNATWRPRDKIDVSLMLERADREYLGDPAGAAGALPPRTERRAAAGLQLAYRPRPELTLEFRLRHERRESRDPLGGFEAVIASAGIRYSW